MAVVSSEKKLETIFQADNEKEIESSVAVITDHCVFVLFS